MDCPDCRCGRSIAFIAVWLSVYMRQFGSAWGLHSLSSANCNAVISAVYTLNCVSVPRWWWLTSPVFAYAAAPIFLSIPEPSVYNVATVTSTSSCVLSWVFFAMSLVSSILVFAFNDHHGGRIYGSIDSMASVVCGNCCITFSRFDRCEMFAVLTLRACCILISTCLGSFWDRRTNFRMPPAGQSPDID